MCWIGGNTDHVWTLNYSGGYFLPLGMIWGEEEVQTFTLQLPPLSSLRLPETRVILVWRKHGLFQSSHSQGNSLGARDQVEGAAGHSSLPDHYFRACGVRSKQGTALRSEVENMTLWGPCVASLFPFQSTGGLPFNFYSWPLCLLQARMTPLSRRHGSLSPTSTPPDP